MNNAVVAGIRYAGIVFVIGFGLGALRTLYVAPRTGDVIAVALELPVMLAASWAACLWATRQLSPQLAKRPFMRAVMGGTALATLLAIECAAAVWMFGRTPTAWLAAFATPAGWLGLAGQIGFGLMPLLVRRGVAG